MSDFDKSLFFYNEAKKMGLKINNPTILLHSYIGLARVAELKQDIDFSIKLLTKSLQFAWYVNDFDQELHIYEIMSRNFYNNQDIERMYYYHERAYQQQLEDQNSPVRKYYLNYLSKFQEQKEFPKQFIKKDVIGCQIPMLNLDEYPYQEQKDDNNIKLVQTQSTKFNNILNLSSGAQIRDTYDYNKNDNWRMIDYQIIKTTLLEDPDIKELKLQLPIFPILKPTNTDINKIEQKIQKISQGEPKYFKFGPENFKIVQNEDERRDLKNPEKYKQTLQQYITWRDKKMENWDKEYGNYEKKIREIMDSNYKQQNQNINHRVYMVKTVQQRLINSVQPRNFKFQYRMVIDSIFINEILKNQENLLNNNNSTLLRSTNRKKQLNFLQNNSKSPISFKQDIFHSKN